MEDVSGNVDHAGQPSRNLTVLPTDIVPSGVEGLAVTRTLTPAVAISNQTFRYLPL